MQLTSVYQKTDDGWYVAWIEEVPGAMTQGRTMEEARTNLREALELMLEVSREEAERELAGQDVFREALLITMP